MTSTNFQIYWDSVNIGGEDTSTSTNFRLRDTIGEHGSGTSTSANFRLSAGYRVGDVQDPFLTFSIGTQENATEVAYSAFSNAGKTVTVSSASGYSVGDYIGVVEDKGLSQLIVTGKITDITGSVLTVDSWSGEPASLSASPGGSDDFVYRMSGYTAALGVQSVSTGKVSFTHTNVTTNASNGYSVMVQSDGDLRVSTSTVITKVSDGTVTVGTEEYGGEVVGSLAVGTGGDFAFSSTSTRTVQESATYGNNDRVGLMYKLAIGTGTPSGNYQQIVTFTSTANY
ncbi:MAG TPA: hypothetical protein VN397_04025 [Candidatus Methylomirabilis sp.]|nr:hypothetical protein [Candidatus Methylomirabilis sp.]